MKTKFIKVSVQERLPVVPGTYFCIIANSHSYMTCHSQLFKKYKGITHWMEEVPDHEEEMREMLEQTRTVIARMKRSMLVHPDHEEGSEFDDLTTSAQEMENKIGEFLTN